MLYYKNVIVTDDMELPSLLRRPSNTGMNRKQH